MPRFAFVLASALVLYSPCASAQERELEVQGGAGYVLDTGEGPSVPTANAGLVLWLTSHMGIGVRLIGGLGNDHFDPPVSSSDRTFLGPGSLRMWAASLQWRGYLHRVEFNAGVGWGGHSYEYEEILTGIHRAGTAIDPIPPTLLRQRYGIGVIASEVLIGCRLGGPLHLKGGFTHGLSGDVHPFQPVVLLVLKAKI